MVSPNSFIMLTLILMLILNIQQSIGSICCFKLAGCVNLVALRT